MMWQVALIILAFSLEPSFGKRVRVRRATRELTLQDAPKYIAVGDHDYGKSYENNSNRTWKINAAGQGNVILLTSLDFLLEDSFDCRYDFVEIFDGEMNAGHSLGKFCGNQEVRLISRHRQVYVNFRSDSTVTASGFHFELRRVPAASSGACNRTISSATGTLTSVGYHGGRYPANTTCLYSIKGLANNRINLTFDDFWLERGDCLFGDYLTVYDGQTSEVEIGRYCGQAAPLYILSYSSEMLLYFYTNGLNITEKGFKLTYTQLPKDGATSYEVVERKLIPEDDSDCTSIITTLGQNVTSPKLADAFFYRGKKECQTVIEAPPSKRVVLQFLNFHLEDSPDCMYDHVNVTNVTYRSNENVSSTVRLCGYHEYHSLCFLSADNRLTLDFRSDLMFEREGYLASYEFIDVNDTIDCQSFKPDERYCAGYWYDNGNDLACACPTETVPPDCTQNIRWTTTLRENLTTYEDKTHSFSCRVNHPRSIVTWDYDFFTLPDSSKPHISVYRNGTLKLSKVRVPDSGTYRCTVQAGSWIDTKSMNLTVKHDVEFCGYASEKITDPNTNLGSAKVTGKNSTKVPDFIPWQVLIWNNVRKQHHCGGVLISERFVLTAGHCINSSKVNVTYRDLVLSLGTTDCKNKGTEKRNIARYILHPKYNNETLEYDMALLELDRPVTTKSKEIYPMCVSSSDKLWNAVKPGTKGRIAGCGVHGTKLADFMHTVTIPLAERKDCQNIPPTFTDDMFCGEADLGDAGTGDSGGAIAVKFENRWTLLGLISFGQEYGFYSNVSMAKDWIEEYAGPCGRRHVNDMQNNIEDGRVYRGEDARPGQFPWATRLEVDAESHIKPCGATFINSNWLITAKHCLCLEGDGEKCPKKVEERTKNNKPLPRVHIVAGTVKKTAPTRELTLVRAVYHRSEDIALLKLTVPVKWNDDIQSACLPRGGVTLRDGMKGSLAGWGYGQANKGQANKDGKYKMEVADHLQYVELVKKEKTHCEKEWAVDFSNKTCFLGENLAKAFQGDSGAGIVWENSGAFTLDGIYVEGTGRPTINLTGIFIDVSKYVPWILKEIGWEF